MAKVSICVPTYNNIEDVKRLLASIEKQSFTDYEVIVTDDSTNNEIQDFITEKAYVSYHRNASPLGHIYNWNEAIKRASGEYIKIMFSDDWFAFEDSLTKMVDYLDYNPQANLVFCGSRQTMLEEDVDKLQRKSGNESFDRFAPIEYTMKLREDYRYLFISNQIGCPSATMYRRNLDGSVTLFDEKSNWASDVFLYMDILKANPQFVYTEEPLICVGMHVNQYTETFGKNDVRIYTDYKYMYNKYNLGSVEEYRLYFLKKYLIGFKQPVSEARANGISTLAFINAKINDLSISVKNFISCRIKK